MDTQLFIEFLRAVHVGQMAEGPFEERGGVLLVAEPGNLKTTCVSHALREYPNVMLLSDVNIPQLARARGMLSGGRFRTIAFMDFLKVYERDQRSSSNTEGVIRALVSEGWQGLASQAQLGGGPEARALVFLCVTPGMEFEHARYWEQTGFSRRFLWIRWQVENHDVIMEAIKQWRSLELDEGTFLSWRNDRMQWTITPQEANILHVAVKEQPDDKISFKVLARAYNTLKHFYWRRRSMKDRQIPGQIISELVPLLTKKGGVLTVKEKYQVAIPKTTERIERPKRRDDKTA